MLKTFKFRIYPTIEQSAKLNLHFNDTRLTYEYFLKYFKDEYVSRSKPHYYDWSNSSILLKNDYEYPLLNKANIGFSMPIFVDWPFSYDKFFNRHIKYPKSKKSDDSILLKNIPIIYFDEDKKLIFFNEFKEGIKIKINAKFLNEYDIKHILISKTSIGTFFISILIV